MLLVRFALALAVAAGLALLAPGGPLAPALAAEPAAGSLHLIPPGPLRADGSEQTVLVLLFDAEGLPVPGATFRGASVSLGAVLGVEAVGSGVYAVRLRAPASAQVEEAWLTLKGRFGARSVEERFPLSFAPPVPALEAAVEPDHLVLGRAGDAPRAEVIVTARGPGGGPASGLRLIARASAGEVGAFTEVAPGRYRALYTPPAESVPRIAHIAVADASRPEEAVAFVALPLWGAVSLPLETGRAHARLTFDVGGFEAGPFEADAAGLAQASLEVPPGVSTARIAIETPGVGRESLTLNLNTPPPARLSFAPTVPYVPADGRRALPLRLQVTDPSGRPARRARLELSATAGEVSKPVSEGPGRFRVDYVPPPVTEPTTVTITAALEGDPAGSRDALTLDLVPAPPARMQGTVQPWPPAGASTVRARATLHDAFDRPAAGDVVCRYRTSSGAGGEVSPSGGVCEADLPANAGVVWLQAAPRAWGRKAEALLAIPLDAQVATGQQVEVAVLALDRFDLPVPDVPIRARVMRGSASVTEAATTDARGMAFFRLSAGALGGPQEVRFESDGLRDDVLIWQSRERLADLPALPLHGGARRATAAATWRRIAARLDPFTGATDLAAPQDAGKGSASGP